MSLITRVHFVSGSVDVESASVESVGEHTIRVGDYWFSLYNVLYWEFVDAPVKSGEMPVPPRTRA